MRRKISIFNLAFLILGISILTYIIPILNWLADISNVPQWISVISIVLFSYVWLLKSDASTFLPASKYWKVFCFIVVFILFTLLIINILHRPVSKITGLARAPFDVIQTIILISLAEELIFRGMIWSMLSDIFVEKSWYYTICITSLLFGVEHLGYWFFSQYTLTHNAILHSISMIAAGVFFGAFRQVTQSLGVPILLHMIANGFILLTQ